MDRLHEKFERLKAGLAGYGGVAVAFSGGVDSTFLLKTAHDALGDRALAVTASSCSFPKRELEEAKRFCRENGVRQEIVESEELDIEGFRSNPKNRCYLCKRELFTKIWEVARANGLPVVAEGSNTDDEGDYRPGLIAIRELGAKSPLRDAGLSKEDIRVLSRELGLPTAEKPSFACLASRFPYGETISEEKLAAVDRAEQLLLDLGFTGQVRVRVHADGKLARIELPPEDFGKLLARRIEVSEKLKSYGFTYVSMDLQGYRTGSMNETLTAAERTVNR